MQTKASPKRHVALRSCVLCGTKTAKRELMRIVARPEGAVALDPSGRLSGRGAYLCKDGRCAQKGLKRGRLEYALRTKLKDEEWLGLLSSVQALSDPG